MSSVPRKEDSTMDYIFKKLAGLNPDRPLTQQQRIDMVNCSRTYFVGLVLLILSLAMIYSASTDSAFLKDRMYLYTALVCAPLIVAAYFILPFFSRNIDSSVVSAAGLLMMIIVAITYFMMQTANKQSVRWASYLFTGIAIGVGIISAIVMFRISLKSLKHVRGWNGFVLNLIFYIPCLLIELYELALMKLNELPRILAITIVFMLSVVVLMYLRPIAIWIQQRGDDLRTIFNYPKMLGTNVLPNIVSLSNKTVVAGKGVLYVPSDSEFAHFVKVDVNNNMEKAAIKVRPVYEKLSENFTPDRSYRKNYSISAWIYLNAVPTGESTTNILVYGGDNSSMGKPAVVYKNNRVVVILTDRPNPSPEMTFELDTPFQQWFMLAVSYDSNKTTVYLNGKIVYAADMDNGMMPEYGLDDVLTVGDKDGLNGAICSVMYYETPVSLSQVVSEYNLLKKCPQPLLTRLLGCKA